MGNEKYLIVIYQNTLSAIQSIEDMYPKFRSSKLKNLMKKEEEKYNYYKEKCEELAKELKVDLKGNNFFTKTMLWTSINMSTLTDKSSTHIAEMFLLGTVRGTIKLYKHLKNSKDVDERITALAKELLDFEEQSYNEIKDYLKV